MAVDLEQAKKEIAAMIEPISSQVKTMDARLTTIEKPQTELPEAFKKAIAEAFAKKGAADKKDEGIKQEQLKGILDIQIWGMDIGKAFIGGGIALFVSELIDGVVIPRFEQLIGKTWAPALIKGLGAVAVKKWGGRLVGTQAADVAALFLTWEAVRSIIPIDEWIKKIFAKKETTSSSSSSSHSSSGDGHQSVDAMDTLRMSLIGGR